MVVLGQCQVSAGSVLGQYEVSAGSGSVFVSSLDECEIGAVPVPEISLLVADMGQISVR